MAKPLKITTKPRIPNGPSFLKAEHFIGFCRFSAMSGVGGGGWVKQRIRRFD
jgi:hypothetical protein